MHIHTHIYQFIGDNIHMCDYRLSLTHSATTKEYESEGKGWGNGSNWGGCELEYNAEEVTGWVKIEAAKNGNYENPQERRFRGDVVRKFEKGSPCHAISHAPDSVRRPTQPLSIISIHRTSCVCSYRGLRGARRSGIQCWRAINQFTW